MQTSCSIVWWRCWKLSWGVSTAPGISCLRSLGERICRQFAAAAADTPDCGKKHFISLAAATRAKGRTSGKTKPSSILQQRLLPLLLLPLLLREPATHSNRSPKFTCSSMQRATDVQEPKGNGGEQRRAMLPISSSCCSKRSRVGVWISLCLLRFLLWVWRLHFPLQHLHSHHYHRRQQQHQHHQQHQQHQQLSAAAGD